MTISRFIFNSMVETPSSIEIVPLSIWFVVWKDVVDALLLLAPIAL